MYDTLLYIATHLDCYHFNTDEARSLKRELQQWTTLPREQQLKAAREQEMLQRFQSMFLNNPFLEKKMLTVGSVGTDGVPGEITGATAEGYFDPQGKGLTLHPAGSQQGSKAVEYYSDETISQFIEEKYQEAEQVQAQFAEKSTTIVQEKKSQFDHILRKASTISGSTVKNPTLFSAAICIFFYIMAFRYVLLDCQLIHFIQIYGKEIFSISDHYRNMLIVAGIVLLVALFRLPTYVNMIVKGVYRASIVHRFKKAEGKWKKMRKRVRIELEPQKWFTQYAQALWQDRGLIESAPDVPPAALRTTVMLQEKPELILFDGRFFPKCPWKRFKATGEKRKVFLPVLLIVVMLVMNGTLPVARILGIV